MVTCQQFGGGVGVALTVAITTDPAFRWLVFAQETQTRYENGHRFVSCYHRFHPLPKDYWVSVFLNHESLCRDHSYMHPAKQLYKLAEAQIRNENMYSFKTTLGILWGEQTVRTGR